MKLFGIIQTKKKLKDSQILGTYLICWNSIEEFPAQMISSTSTKVLWNEY